MVGCFGGSKFSKKCKRAVNRIQTRAKPIRGRNQANATFQKRVVAGLLASGQEDEAFRRIDALLLEINHTACYEIIEKFCEVILSQLPALHKQRECTQEAQEAMATLIFAAARFPDLPELYDLRHLFTRRYGDQIESSTNVEFVKRIQKKSFSREEKLNMMRDIVEEFSIKLDPREFSHKQSTVPSANFNMLKKAVSSHAGDEASATLVHELKDEILFKGNIKGAPWSVLQKQQRQMELKDIDVALTTENGRSLDSMETKRLVDCEEENFKPYKIENAVPPYMIPPYARPKSEVSAQDDRREQHFGVDNYGEAIVPSRDRRTAVDDEVSIFLDYRKLLPEASSNQRRHGNQRTATGEHDEDEVAVDRLLMLYGKKGKAIEPGGERRKTRTHPMRHIVDADEIGEYQRGNTGPSLPAEPVSPDVLKAPAQTTLVQPDLLSPSGGVPVHPRMPDYDRLAARLAALRNTQQTDSNLLPK